MYFFCRHEFCPEHLQSRLSKNGIKANRETFKAILDRYCQKGDMEGASAILKVGDVINELLIIVIRVN